MGKIRLVDLTICVIINNIFLYFILCCSCFPAFIHHGSVAICMLHSFSINVFLRSQSSYRNESFNNYILNIVTFNIITPLQYYPVFRSNPNFFHYVLTFYAYHIHIFVEFSFLILYVLWFEIIRIIRIPLCEVEISLANR